MKSYKSKSDSFPSRTINYLRTHGESNCKDIRRVIGLNEHCKTSRYSDRSSYYFNVIAGRLVNRGVIVRTKRGHYKLVP